MKFGKRPMDDEDDEDSGDGGDDQMGAMDVLMGSSKAPPPEPDGDEGGPAEKQDPAAVVAELRDKLDELESMLG